MNPMHRLSAALVVACLLTPAVSIAQGFPSKPIRWIVPFPPGGPTDTFSRPVAQKLSELLGQPVIVENVPGAGASIGSDRIAKAAPDGYTIGLATTGSHAINPHLYGARLPHDTLKDFTPLTLAVGYVNVLVVGAKLPVNTLGDLIEQAKANPGKATFGSAGNGSSNHLSGEVLKFLTGAPFVHVPYRGSAPALADVAGGNTWFMFDILNTALPMVESGRVRAIAVTSAKRSPYAPNIPTMAEAGVTGFAEAGSDLWFGIVGPAGLPRPVVDKLNAALVQALRSPDIRQRVSAQAFEIRTSTSGEFADVIRTDREKWGRIVKAAGARIE